jgi:hypothetical protein
VNHELLKELIGKVSKYGFDKEEKPVVLLLPFKKYALFEGKHRVLTIGFLFESVKTLDVRCLLPSFSNEEGERLMTYFEERKTENSSSPTFYEKVFLRYIFEDS